MIVQVSSIDPNPYRRMDKYPISREKVESLKCSITQTGFWDNILLRQAGDRFQLAYGHHRLIAIKEVGIKEVDVPVRPLDDATMLRVMANENMTDWKSYPAIINETVFAAKEFIDSELAKHETWDSAPLFIKELIGAEPAFRNVKARGSGGETILKFLGGNWKQWMIQEALETLRLDSEHVVDRKAAEMFESMGSATVFKESVKRHDIPFEDQAEVAAIIIEEGRDSKRGIPEAVLDVAIKKGLARFEDNYPQPKKPILPELLTSAIFHAMQIYNVMESFFDYPDQVEPEEMKKLVDLLMKINKVIVERTGAHNEIQED